LKAKVIDSTKDDSAANPQRWMVYDFGACSADDQWKLRVNDSEICEQVLMESEDPFDEDMTPDL